jgi:hypothetical protein
MAKPRGEATVAESAPAWTIIGQAEEFRQNKAGAFVSGVTVTFTTAGGQQGSVFLPNEEYTEANVKKAVGDRASVMANVAGLTG